MTTSSKSRFNSLAHTLAVATASLLLCTPISAQADIIELYNGDLLTGNILSLDKILVTLKSPIADTPLKIKAEAIRKITFPDQPKDTPNHSERLTLTNNDVIPCKVLTLNDTDLQISTWYAGKFSIPRNNIQFLQFGLSEEKNIYTGNDEPSQWSTHKGWSRTSTGYSCRGNGTLARKLDLPENVRFNFDLSWEKSPDFESPDFAFRFCAESDAATTNQDTYEFIFNSDGMQIRRYESSKQPAGPLANIPIRPHSIATRKLNIDLRVNRTEGLLTLSIDNQLIGTWPDPFNTSKGNYIILNNGTRSTRSTICVISNLRVSGINDGSLPRHREKTLASKAHVLIDSQGEKMSGTIITISNKNTDKRSLVFNVKHATAPLHVPDHRISTLIFGQPKDTPKPPFSTFTAMLKNNGSLQLAQPKLVKGKISCQHPILGPCLIDINALRHIQQSSAKSKTP